MVHNRKLSRRQILRSAVAMGGVAVGSQVLSACSTLRQGDNAQSGKSEQGGETLTIGFVPIACASPLVAADGLSLIHISEPTRREWLSRMPSSA